MIALYPVYIHKDAHSSYGMTFPDFPGCFSAADDLTAVPRMAQEAIEVHFAGENFPIPSPSAPENWLHDERFQAGYWMLIPIDLSRICSQPIKLDIVLPEYLVQQIDTYVKSHYQSRSDFFEHIAKTTIYSYTNYK